MKTNTVIAVAVCLTIVAGCTPYQINTQNLSQNSTNVSTSPTQSDEKRVLKRKVAISRFSNETKYGNGFFSDPNLPEVGKQAMDILSQKLAATNKFILLERSDLNSIQQERGMAKLDSLKIPADYLIIGSISEFGRKETGESGVFTRSKKQTAYAKVNVRLVDIHTGQIIYSEEGTGEAFSEAGTVIGIGSKAGYDATLNDKAISAAISQLVGNVVSNLMDKPWRSYILDFTNGAYIIAGGNSQGVINGDNFEVYQRGKQVTNPQTGMPIELPAKQVGQIMVTAVTGTSPDNEVSICSKVQGELPEADFLNFYIQEISKETR